MVYILAKKEFDVIAQTSSGFLAKYRTIVVFEIDGGEHIGSKITVKLDREKETICSTYGIKLIRIPNSAVKDYESIISLFESVIKNIHDIDDVNSELTLFDLE